MKTIKDIIEAKTQNPTDYPETQFYEFKTTDKWEGVQIDAILYALKEVYNNPKGKNIDWVNDNKKWQKDAFEHILKSFPEYVENYTNNIKKYVPKEQQKKILDEKFKI